MTMALALMARWAARQRGQIVDTIDFAESVWDDFRDDRPSPERVDPASLL